jgi:hypothetical protein
MIDRRGIYGINLSAWCQGGRDKNRCIVENKSGGSQWDSENGGKW